MSRTQVGIKHDSQHGCVNISDHTVAKDSSKSYHHKKLKICWKSLTNYF